MQPTDFSSYQYSAVKSYCSWRHVRRQYTKTTTFSNYTKNYNVLHQLRGNVFLMGIYQNWLFQIVTVLFLLAKRIHWQPSSDSKYFPFSDIIPNGENPWNIIFYQPILGYKCSFMPSELENFPPHATSITKNDVPIFWSNLSIFHRMHIWPIGKCTSRNSGHHSLIASVFKFQLAETYSSSFFRFVQSILCLFMEIIMRRKPITRDHRVHA